MATSELDQAYKEKTDTSIPLKTKITGVQISFRLQQVFAAMKEEVNFLVEKIFCKEE